MPPNAVMHTLDYLWPILQQSCKQIAIAGGIALSYWGNPRSTQDIDLAMIASDNKDLASILRNAGLTRHRPDRLDLELFELEQWSFESDEFFVSVEVDLMLGTSGYYRDALRRSVHVNLDGVQSPVRVLSREDLILHKLFAERLIDQADVQLMLELHADELDNAYLEQCVSTLRIEASYQTALQRFRESGR